MSQLCILFSRLQRLLLIFAVLSVSQAVTAQTAVTKLLDAPVKSDIDQRGYRNLELTNGMKVLLISDPAADKAAAAVDVEVGSGSDPESRQGLAHFLEHMLFLGTKKFPKSGEYQAFISANGGTHNAYTSLEHTNYFFDIDPKQLQPALERFSQFFVAPLFNDEYVEREKNAVNAEYKARINDDSRRAFDVYRELYAKENPAAKFSVGSLDTLADRPNDKVRDDLLAFYQQHYSANTMTLVVLGRESLPALQALVEQYFSDVPNRHVAIDNTAKPVFRQGLLPAKVLLQSKKDARHLTLAFPLPAMQSFYRTKPAAYVSYLLGHEGEGSLLHVLKQKGWAESLMAGTGFSNRFAASMDVTIKLTEEGYRHIDDITALFFDAVDLLRKQGVEDWRYQEQKNMTDIAFRFVEKGDAMSFTSSLANNLQYFPAKEVMRGDFLMEGLDKKQVNAVLHEMRPSNVLVSVSSPDIQGDKHSLFYNVPYRVASLSADDIKKWEHLSNNSGLALPAANPFVPDNLKLKAVAQPRSKLETIPQKVVAEENFNLWFFQDTQFRVPKGDVTVYLRSDLAADTAQHAAMTELFVRLVQDKLNPSLYAAMMAGMDLSIVRLSRGISFSSSGYSEKQVTLLKMLADLLKAPEFDEARFQLVKREWTDELRNEDKLAPYVLLRDDVSTVLVHRYWERKQLLRALETISLNDVQQLMAQVVRDAQADVLVYGNFVQEDAMKLGGIVQGIVSRGKQSPVPSQVVSLMPASQPALYVDAMPHNDAALIKYFQAKSDDIEHQVHLQMLGQVLAAPFFDRLRTEQQLGYIVAGRYLPLVRVPGLVFIVQSPSHSVADINARANDFIRQYYSVIEKKDDAWFEQQKRAVMVQLEEKPKNQAEQAILFWVDLILGYANFDSNQQKISTLQKMTKQDLLQAYHEVLLAPETRELLFVSPGKLGIQAWLDGEAKAYKKIDDIDAFKNGLPSYSLP
ncbi:MAG: insulinase family protein [Cellvibrionales bacterium]|nr:insulinase family protein [Cellvibrionales bacterium]